MAEFTNRANIVAHASEIPCPRSPHFSSSARSKKSVSFNPRVLPQLASLAQTSSTTFVSNLQSGPALWSPGTPPAASGAGFWGRTATIRPVKIPRKSPKNPIEALRGNVPHPGLENYLVLAAAIRKAITRQAITMELRHLRCPLPKTLVSDEPSTGSMSRSLDCASSQLRSEPKRSTLTENKRVKLRHIANHPLIFRGEVLGVLAVFSRQPISLQNFQWLGLFADQAAVAIANAKAFEEIENLRQRLELENEYLRSEVKENFGGFVGGSAALRKILEQIDLVAPVEANVLILGESGTGKELVARAIHERSKRKDRTLVRVNCASSSLTSCLKANSLGM